MLFFCTVLLSCAFLLPKNSKVANAATPTTLTTTMTVTEQLNYQWAVATGYSDTTIDYNTIKSGGGDHTIDTSTSKKISIYNTVLNGKADCVYVGFQVSVKIPAWTKYKMTFPFTMQAVKVNAVDGLVGRTRTELLYYGCTTPTEYTAANANGGSPLSFNKSYSDASNNGYDGAPTVGANVTSELLVAQNQNTTNDGKTKKPKQGTTSIEETYANESDKEITVGYNFGFFANNFTSGTASKVSLGLKACPTFVQLGACTVEAEELWVPAPTDVSLDYTGSDLRTDAGSLIENDDWYTKSGADYYTLGSWVKYELPTTEIIDVKQGGYEAKAVLTNKYPFKLQNGSFTNSDQTFKITVKPVDPTVTVLVNKSGSNLYDGETLSDVTIELDPSANNPKGTVAWSSPNSTLKTGTNAYQYEFFSQDPNYNSVTLSTNVTVGAVELEKIKAEYTQDGKVFSTTDVSKGLPGTLVVTKIANNGSPMGTLTPSQYTLAPKSALTAGNTCKVVVMYTEDGQNYEAEIDVKVSAPQLTRITAELLTGNTVYESTSMTALAQMLNVRAYYEDGTDKKLGFNEFTVTGKLVKSTNSTVTVTVNNKEDWEKEKSGESTLSVYVEPAAVDSITAVFSPVDEHGTTVDIYDRTATSELKPYLKVTAKYEDGSTRELSAEEYTIKGSLKGKTTALLTVEYGGKSEQFQVNNIIKAQLVRAWVEAFDQGSELIYDSDDLDVLKEYLVVKAEYSHKSGEAYIITDECTFDGELVASDTELSVIRVLFEGKQTDNGEIKVKVTAGNFNLLEKVTASDVKLVYNGAEQTLALKNVKDEFMTVKGISETAVGKYKAVIALKDTTHNRWDDRSKDDIEIEWEITQVVLSFAVNSPEYNGEEVALKSLISLSDAQWRFISATGDVKGTDAGNYSATFIIDEKHFGNVVWGERKSAAKNTVKYSLADNTGSAEIVVEWEITPAKVSALWNESGEIPVLNLSSPSIANVPSDLIIYTFKDRETGKTVKASELEKGHSYDVTATLNTDDPRACNYAFTAQTKQLLAQPYELNIPEAPLTMWQKTVNFFKANWLWFLIGFLVLLFLIILICVIVHRKKTKEERAAKKEAKEEEKRRREEEREEEKRRREAERELEKAKAEAELAKMRAGLGLGAGAAGMAMAAQQPQQQPVQQQMPQQMPMQMPQMMQMPQYIPVSMQMPMQMPQYPQNNFGPQPGYGGGGNNDGGAISRLENAFMSMRAEQRTDAKLENELLKLRLDMKDGNSPAPRQPVYEQPTAAPNANANGNNAQLAEQFGMMMAAMMKSMGVTPKAKEEPKPVLTESTLPTAVETPTVYPPDAVITTTTTVDTTKPKIEPVSRDTERNFDIDGFYDSFDPNKNSL